MTKTLINSEQFTLCTRTTSGMKTNDAHLKTEEGLHLPKKEYN